MLGIIKKGLKIMANSGQYISKRDIVKLEKK